MDSIQDMHTRIIQMETALAFVQTLSPALKNDRALDSFLPYAQPQSHKAH